MLISLLSAAPAMAQYAPAPGYYAPPPAGYQGYPPPAAQGAKLVGLELSAALGFAMPSGDLADGTAMSDFLGVHVPVIVGVGYRLNPLLSLGGTLHYAFGTTKNCPAGESCSASDIRFAAEARLHFNAQSSFAPTLGFGLGYEWLSLTEEANGASSTMTVKGLSIGVEFGGDLRLAPQFVLTPFLGLHAGQFSSIDLEASGISQSADIPDSSQTFHEWLLIGCRGTFTL